MKTLTINELHKLCSMEMAKGNGRKKILISNDDEGNGFHELLFSFTPTLEYSEMNSDYLFPCGNSELKDYIILG